jgi:hypothetical protein
MVATPRSASPDSVDSALDPDLVTEVAALRARGASWEDAAAKVRWDVGDLCRVLRRDPTYPAALEAAEDEAYREGQADGFARLCALTHDPDPDRAERASAIILKFTAERRRDQTRLEVERLRAEGRRLKATRPANGDADDAGEREREPYPATAEEKAQWDAEVKAAAEKFAGRATVYLWGGCHRTDAPPDETDTELSLRPADDAIPGRVIYWARVNRLIGRDPRNGPFLPPPGCKPNEVPIYTG